MFFTSDTHFRHTNIIKYSNRPYANVQEMDEALIRNWNDKVGMNDTIYHLGDFTFSDDAANILRRLNGKKHLILGNHDHNPRLEHGWESINHYKEVYTHVGGKKKCIILCHYGMRVWNKSHHGAWMLYGHSHGTLPDDPTLLSFDVGVDCWNYRPLHVSEVEQVMNKKTPKLPDYHGRGG